VYGRPFCFASLLFCQSSSNFRDGPAQSWKNLGFLEKVFTALHGMQTRSSDENSVRRSVRLSNVCIVTKRKKTSVQIFIPYEKAFSLVFWEEEWLVGDDPFYLKFWVNQPSLEWNRKEVHYALSNKPRLSSYVAPKPQKGAQKRKTAVFPLKSSFAWRKSATKFLSVKTVSDKV